MVAKRLNLHGADDDDASQSGPPGEAEKRFRREARAQLSTAKKATTHYYSNYFGLGPSAAFQTADEMVNGAVSGMFGCEREG
jgi:hypothetical protein